jgi:pentatricopeptide repeat protein
LLRQLEATAGESNNARQSPLNASQRFSRPIHKPNIVYEKTTDPEALLEPPLRNLRHLCLILSKEGTQSGDEEIWNTMKNVMRTFHNPGNAQLLLQDLVFRKRFNHWIARTVDRWLESTLTPDRPVIQQTKNPAAGGQRLTPHEALKCKYYLNPHPGKTLLRTIWRIAREIAEYQSAHPKSSQPAHAVVVEGLRELMRLWHLSMAVGVCGHEVVHPSGTSSKWGDILNVPTLDWSFLPDPTVFIENLQHRAHRDESRLSFGYIMDMLIRSNVQSSSQWKDTVDVESCAIVTLGLLQKLKSKPGGSNTIREYEPWMRFIEFSMKNAGTPYVPAALAQRMMELGSGDARRRSYQYLAQGMNLSFAASGNDGPIERAWEESTSSNGLVPIHAVKSEDNMPEGLAKAPPPNNNSSHVERLTYLSIKRLGRAVEQLDIRAAERVRQDIVDFKSGSPGVTMSQALYENMIYSFLRLRSIRTAVKLWEEMVKEGHVPRINTYTSMMRGSQHLKDLASMEYFWNKMREARIQPDATAWSTRLTGLFGHGHIDAGLKALSEMGQNWLLAAKQAYVKEQGIAPKRNRAPPTVPAAQLLARYEGDIDGVPRPTVVTMNSAITALSRGPDHLIPKVLAWGRSFGIEPDLITYNAFLHVAMRHNQGDEALKILQRMRARNIEVDSNTWTIILTDMLVGGYLDGLSAQEQEAKVFEFLSIVDAEGANGLNQKAYALLLDRLLKNYENHPAAQAVLTHMTAKGLQPSTHIYTILMDSHLQQDPPNFSAADSLWEHIQSAKGGYGAALDSKFFDLVIKGYAPHHATVGTEKILGFLGKMGDEGKRPSWSALEAVARALAEASQWPRLAQIVDKTRRRLRDEKGIDTGPGQWSFWQFVISTGILRHERITMPEQIMGMPSHDSPRR